ncbi:MAG: Na/Pi cotransporter family protein [Lachnospiraceae bacterium]|jgi:phosphate:Na+ symporter|nr:Na/Pi cotransporter family protein [Lachnospiraceae bacterium]
MDIFGFLQLLGGLALFLYGMNVMGDGLTQASGSKLEKLLEKLTSSKWKGVILGLVVTAIIQSSSATTVMVVGFVNSGIMKLQQAIGVIMGANIGTTVTAWILSLTGLEGDSFFVQIFKPNTFSPILAVIGVVLILFLKSDKKKNTGMIMVGFAILMFGMNSMTESVSALSTVPEFRNMMVAFSNPIIGVLVGTVITAIIQSSSASVGILQALCATGLVNIGTAIPIIMGQNIGTCVTAAISSIGANKNAKRAALVHFYFNLVGTILVMAIFYGLNAILRFAFLDDVAKVTDIAIFHSLFNVLTTVLLLPLSKLLEKLAYMTLPTTAEESQTFSYIQLDERFLENPPYAVSLSRNVTNDMMDATQKGVGLAMEALHDYRKKSVEEVKLLEDVVDQYEDRIGTYLVRLGNHSMLDADNQQLTVLLHCIGDFERISDHSVNLVQSAKELAEKELGFTEKAEKELKIYSAALTEIIAKTFTAFRNFDLELAAEVEPLEEVIDKLTAQIKKRHYKRLSNGKTSIEVGFILQDILTNYERIADHCSNIAICLLQSEDKDMVAHRYQDSLSNQEKQNFSEHYRRYLKQFELP